MRVLLIDVNCRKGSTGKIVYDLYTAINKSGNEAAICYGRGENITEKNIYKFGLDLETNVHALLTRITGVTGCFSFFSTRRLLKFLKEFKPDVVHIHELHAYFVNIKPVINYLKKNGIKTVFTMHCEFLYTGKCGYAEECLNWQKGCGNCPHLKTYPATYLFDWTKQMFNSKKKLMQDLDNIVITAPSKWLADRAAMSFLKGKDIRVVHNGIATDSVFFPREYDHLKKKHGLTDEKIVLAVAPDIMCDRKGGRHVVEAAKRLAGENIKFIMVGVTDLSEKFPENVIALGRTENQKELAEYYSMADVFVICSENENFPTTCLESQCCGTPVCGFDIGGIMETDVTGTTENFVAFKDYDGLSAVIKRMCAEPKDPQKMSSLAIDAYSTDRMFENYDKIYRELV